MVGRLLLELSLFRSARSANFSSITSTNNLIPSVHNHNNDQSNRTARPGFFNFLDKQIVTKSIEPVKGQSFLWGNKEMNSKDSKSKILFFLRFETEKYLKILKNSFYFAYLGRHWCHLTG